MSVRTVRASITLAPHRFLLSAWPWRAVLYLVSGVAAGTVLLSAVQLLAINAVFPEWVIVAGLVLVLGVAVSAGAPYMARWGRLCQGLVVPSPVQRAEEPRADGWRARVRAQYASPRLGREVAYTVLSLSVLYAIDMAVLLGSLGLPLLGILRFVGAEHLSPVERGMTVAAWALVWPVGLYLVAAWSSVRSEIVTAVLSAREEQLAAELSEVTSSRAALVAAFDEERKRIERDLHDGAQQRLVAVKTSLGLARLDLPEDSPAAESVRLAQQQVTEALAELRDLVRGIHPQVLVERGLRAALLDVAARARTRVEVDVDLPGRLPRPVESTAYFVVCEAIVNAAKHAPGSAVRVVGRSEDGVLRVEVTDTGPGGARPDGSGLNGLRHRLAVVSGTLFVDSPEGGPTTVRLEIPEG